MNLKEQLKKCDELYENSDYAGLIEKCDEILKEYPKNQNAMGYKGISHCFLGQYEEARKILERGVELYPKNYYLKNNLAMVYYDLGEYEASLKLCDEGLKIRDFDWLCKNKIKALIKLNRMDDAKEFERTMGHGFNIADVYLEEGMIEDALNYYYGILKDKPDNYNTIEMIKLIIYHYDLNAAPEIGDFYLKWIDSIRYSQDYDRLDSNSGNPELNAYSTIKIIDLSIALKKFKGNIRVDELKKKLATYDDREFDALIARLLEIGYLEKPDEDHVKMKKS